MKNGGCNKFCTDVITFCIIGQGIWFLINGIAEEKKCTKNKEKEVEKKKEKVSV